MKYKLHLLITCVAFLASIIHSEELQDFLKRIGTGNATRSDLHTNFHGSVFVSGQVFEVDSDKLVEFWKQQKAAKTELVVDKFTMMSKTESPDDNKGAVISAVAKVNVTEKVAGSTMKIESVSHFIVLRDSDGAFRTLYLAAPKQVRKVESDRP